jgi:hypothetical protein
MVNRLQTVIDHRPLTSKSLQTERDAGRQRVTLDRDAIFSKAICNACGDFPLGKADINYTPTTCGNIASNSSD